jgi:hypothetical protein
MKWCFDTSALIEPWVRLYPRDIMAPVWAKLEELAAANTIGAPEEVLIELSRQQDELFEWGQGQGGMFLPPDRASIEGMKKITNDFPGLVKTDSTKSAGDPWVISLAQIHRVPIVQYEGRAKRGAPPKIPNVCDALGIRCVTLVDVLRAEGFAL